jgi:hypothetical protein
VAGRFYTSREYLGKLVTGYYMQLLHRAPRPDEQSTVNNYMQMVLNGRDENVIASLAVLDEYFNRP